MSRDIYAPLSGAMAAWRHLESTANNISNSTTVGFKEHRVRFELTPSDSPFDMAESYVNIDQDGADMSDGAVRTDGVPTHFALRGDAFFTERVGGTEYLVRSGQFQLDDQGLLRTMGGGVVLGENGPIEVPEQRGIVVTPEGTIFTDDGIELDKLKMRTAARLTPAGGTRWNAETPAQPATNYTIVQGALEESNTDEMRGMVELMEATHYFQMYQKAMQTSDEMDAKMNTVAGA